MAQYFDHLEFPYRWGTQEQDKQKHLRPEGTCRAIGEGDREEEQQTYYR